MNKILITLQGRTLILYYQVKHRLANAGAKAAHYIEVLPLDELAKFDLKGLTPEMFCVNIADMVNLQGVFAGQVENERQISVARWSMSKEEYLQATLTSAASLTHKQIVALLALLQGYQQETDNQYIDFEESLIAHEIGGKTIFSGYRLTINTEEIEGNVSTSAYYSLDTRTGDEWQGTPPPQADYEIIRLAIENKLRAIRETGVSITQAYDETDYSLADNTYTPS